MDTSASGRPSCEITFTPGSLSASAVQKDIRCILATQVVLNGKNTIWAAQHDKTTLTPATARPTKKDSILVEAAGEQSWARFYDAV